MTSLGVANLALLPKSARRRALIASAVRLTLRAEKAKAAGEINVVFAARAKMRALNRQFLGHDYDTDVIAFNYDQVPGGPLGDIFVSASRARIQARQLGHSVLEEILTLTIHGTLHLLGYDDQAPRQKAAMFKRQDALLAKVLGKR